MNETAHKWLSSGALLLAISLLAWSATRLAWQVADPAPTGAGPGPARATDAGGTVPPEQLARQVASANLFGRAAAPVSRAPQRRKAPVSRLNLELVGVIATGDADGLALVADDGGREKIYAVGSELPGGAVLREVLGDAILMEVNGREEMLPLRKPSEGAATGRPRAAASRRGGRGGAVASSLAGFRDSVLGNPAQLVSMVAARPVSRNGEFRGYALSPRGRGREVFRMLGLRPGDVVVGLNGVRLDSQTAALGALQNLAQAAEIELDIERRGQAMSIRRAID